MSFTGSSLWLVKGSMSRDAARKRHRDSTRWQLKPVSASASTLTASAGTTRCASRKTIPQLDCKRAVVLMRWTHPPHSGLDVPQGSIPFLSVSAESAGYGCGLMPR